MAKNNKSKKSNIYSIIKKNSSKSIPVINKGFKKVGNATSIIVVKSVPVIEKGVSTIYGTLATGFNMGIEGTQNVINRANKFTKHRKSKNSKRRTKKTRRTNRS